MATGDVGQKQRRDKEMRDDLTLRPVSHFPQEGFMERVKSRERGLNGDVELRGDPSHEVSRPYTVVLRTVGPSSIQDFKEGSITSFQSIRKEQDFRRKNHNPFRIELEHPH